MTFINWTADMIEDLKDRQSKGLSSHRIARFLNNKYGVEVSPDQVRQKRHRLRIGTGLMGGKPSDFGFISGELEIKERLYAGREYR